MRFGLWVAFGVADRDSRLCPQPDFVARQPEPAGTGIDGSIPLCLTRARGWLAGELPRIVRDYGLDWLKFDQPMIAACLDPGHGHDTSVRGSLQANTQALYDILRGLREGFPELFVEFTFDGAGYLDYGLYARSHTAWLDDAVGDPSQPMRVVQQSFYGASLALPLASSPSGWPAVRWATAPPGRGTSPQDLAYQGYSTMGGAGASPCAWATWTRPRRRRCAIWCRTTAPSASCSPGPSCTTWRPPWPCPPALPPAPRWTTGWPCSTSSLTWGGGPSWPSATAGAGHRIAVRLRGLASSTGPPAPSRADGRQVADDLGAALTGPGLTLELPPYAGFILWIAPTA